jgi:hypothetical protein
MFPGSELRSARELQGSEDGVSEPAAAPEDRTLRSRYEIKYLVPENVALAIERRIAPMLSLDRYSSRAGGYYPIVSLYLDSKDLRLYRDTVEGKAARFKLRVRSYGDGQPCFLEVKRRSSSIIKKSRARVDPALLARLLPSPDPGGVPGCEGGEDLERFKLHQTSLAAAPLLLVRYSRKAYEDDSPNRVRVTFDRDIRYAPWREPSVPHEGPRWERVPMTSVVLEIKFTGRFPAWVARLAGELGLGRQSVCKYAISLGRAAALGQLTRAAAR